MNWKMFNDRRCISLLIVLYSTPDSVGVRFNGLLWGAVMICTAVVVFFPHPMGFKALLASIILRFICTFGLRITLFLLGLINVSRFSCYWLFWSTVVLKYSCFKVQFEKTVVLKYSWKLTYGWSSHRPYFTPLLQRHGHAVQVMLECKALNKWTCWLQEH